MANFFSADYWKALFFKAMGGQATAVDPNAMRGSFAGSSTFTGTLELPVGFIAGSFAGTSTFVGTATNANPDFYTIDTDGLYWERRRKRQERHSESVLDDIQVAIRAVIAPAQTQPDLPPVITEPLTTTERDAVADKVLAINRQLERAEIDRLILQTEAALLQRMKEIAAEEDDEIILLLVA